VRERHPRSAWHLLMVPLCVAGIAGAWIGIVLALLKFRGLLCPGGAFLCNGTRVGNIFLHVAPGFPALAIGLIVGNFLFWCIPVARAASEQEMPGRADKVYRTSQVGLAKLGVVLAGIALPVSLLGASNLFALTADRMYYRPMFSVTTRSYDWASVRRIETGCFRGKSTSYNFVVTLADGRRIDLMEESPQEFWEAYPQVQAALRGQSYEFSSAGLVGSCVAAAPQRWLQILANRPTE
jgi:hypothetical protein